MASKPSGTPSATALCTVCEFEAENVKKLKTHLLLKHPKLNLCLFCVDKKGWSDNFASAAQYQEHYNSFHKGTIGKHQERRREEEEKRRIKREEVKKKLMEQEEERLKELGTSAKRRKIKIPRLERPLDECLICPDHPLFENDLDFHQHLMCFHDYDYCKLCKLIGPRAAVRCHIGDRHPRDLCHVCCNSSPVFKDAKNLRAHLADRHGFERDEFPCQECKEVLKDREEYQKHLLNSHLTRGDILRPMRSRLRRKKIGRVPVADPEDEKEVKCVLRSVAGIKNESGQDCFAAAVIHLLAQTDLGDMLDTPESHYQTCLDASCILGSVFRAYKSEKLIEILRISQNYSSFNIRDLPVDAGDFLREALSAAVKSTSEHRGDKNLEAAFKVSLAWKYECQGCQRFLVTNLNDFVLRIDGSKEGTLQNLLDKHLHRKKCRMCGKETTVKPSVRQAGKYVFVEVDRALDMGNDSKELVLFPLHLQPSYNLFGFKYRVVGTVNYNLEHEEGGHYVTYLFSGKFDVTKIHETEVTKRRKMPGYDADTVLLALEKVEMSESDLRQIEMEIEYEETQVENEIRVPLSTSDDTSQVDLPVSSMENTSGVDASSLESIEEPLPDLTSETTPPVMTGVRRSKESKSYVRKTARQKAAQAPCETDIASSTFVVCDEAPKDINLDNEPNVCSLKRQSMLKINFD